MKTIFNRAAAMLLSAALLCCGQPISAAAADPAPVVLKTVCPGYEPLSDDMLYLVPDPAVPVSIRLLQHSPERQNLLLYETTLTPSAAGTKYACAVEPGDYTLSITYAPVKSSISSNQVIDHSFTVANADYSEKSNPFEKSEITVSMEAHLCSASETIAPAAGTPTVKTQNGLCTSAVSIKLDYYNGERGDFDGNAVTDVSDAQLVLKEYVESLSGKKSAATAMQTAVCDIDGDGRITASDAQYILMFYTQTVAGKTPQWPDGAQDHRFAGK